MRLKMLFALTVLALLYWSCSDKTDAGLPTAPVQSLHGDPNVTFMMSQLTATDSIDSTGSWFSRNDTLYWVMETDSAEYDTVPAQVAVRNDTAMVSGAVVPGLPMSVNITGTLGSGTGDSFPGSAWKISRIAVFNPPDSLSALQPAGSALFIYFSALNHKVYTADAGEGLEKLGVSLVLECPIAFYGPMFVGLGYQIDTAKSDCDTLWFQQLNYAKSPPDTLNGYVVGNPATAKLDVYLMPLRFKITSIPIEF